MNLFYRKLGEGPVLIILHGMYGMSYNWLSIGKTLSDHFEVYLPDQRNHGRSPHDPCHRYNLLREDLSDFMNQHLIERAVLVGHSMGGKTAMAFAIKYPERVNALVVIDISPRSYLNLSSFSKPVTDHMNIITGMMNVDFSKVHTREEIEAQLVQVIHSHKIRHFLLKNAEHDGQNGFRWRINLEALRNELPHILEGITDDARQGATGITGFPVHFIRGGRSEYVTDEDMPLIKNIFPLAETTVIDGAGHWIHAEQPEILVRTILQVTGH